MVDLDGILAALAEPTRRHVVELLRDGPRRAGELAEASDLSAAAMSRHLRVLRSCGLVEEARSEADARVRLYRLRRAPFEGLQAWLEELEGLWSEQLGAFKAHVESRPRRSRR